MRGITVSPDPVQKYRDRIQYLVEMSGVAVVIAMDHSQLTVIVHFLQFFRISSVYADFAVRRLLLRTCSTFLYSLAAAFIISAVKSCKG